MKIKKHPTIHPIDSFSLESLTDSIIPHKNTTKPISELIDKAAIKIFLIISIMI